MSAPVITWMGTVNPLGRSLFEFRRRMFAGESGVRPLGSLTSGMQFPVSCAGLIEEGFYPDVHKNLFKLETELILQEMLAEFLRDGRPWEPVDAIIYGTNEGLPTFSEIQKYADAPGAVNIANLRAEYGLVYLQGLLAGLGQPELATHNAVTFVNGCVTGLLAIGFASQRIRAGRNRRVLVVNTEARVRTEDLLRYHSLGALSRHAGDPTKASRPFSKSRSGFVKGEGGGMMIMEAREVAEKRGSEALAEVLAFSTTSDAWRLTDGRQDLGGMTKAITLALEGANSTPAGIDYINAHGSSTPMNDLLETQGIKKVFGVRAKEIPVSSLKSQIGHLNYACGMVETIASVLMLLEQKIAPTLNYDEPDPECDLYYVPNKAESRPLRRIFKNSFGFGGANACLVLGKAKF
jgi:3-oxoacyl-[acyl-carrier-protein] synthase II